MIAQSVDEEILTAIDRSARARVPRLRLNLDDNDYFRARLTNAAPVPSPSKVSHELIDKAFCEAREQVKRIVSGFDEKDHGDTLGWRPRAVGRRARRRGGGAPRTLAGNRRTAADRGRGQERHVRDGGPRRRPGADSRAAPCGASVPAAGGAAVVLERLSGSRGGPAAGLASAELLPGSNCLSQTNRVRASTRRSASTSASAQIRSVVVAARRDGSRVTAGLDEPAHQVPQGQLREQGQKVLAS